ncbi:MAG: retroviral-like aspartic protease family protein [Gemmatimonadota bacterium]|nr:retroviral-like aspartic protease family protein [Gemmatimonadota bacterium]
MRSARLHCIVSIRVAALAVSVALSAALFGPTACTRQATVDPEPDDLSGGGISVKRMRVRQTVSASTAGYWSSVSALDVSAARSQATTVSQRFFTDALGDLTDGNVTGAEVLFHSLIADPDPLLRGRARIGLTVSLNAQGKWQELAALTTEARSDSNANLVDRAAVDAWAGVLRNVAPVEVDAPVRPQILPILGSSVGTPIISVLLNGHQHYFWLDTGASMTLISTDVASESGVIPIAVDTLAIAAAQGRIAARPAVARVVQMGTITIRNLPVALLDPTALRLDKRVANGRILNVKLDGVIGSDVMRRLSVVLDMGAGTIALAQPATHAPKLRSLIWIGFPVVRLLTRNGHPVLFGLDTGADSTLVTDSWMDKTPDPELTAATGSVDVLGAKHSGGLPVLRRVTVGDGDYVLRLGDVPIVQERRQTFVTLDGVLGADVLAHATLHMDITNGIFAIRAPGVAPFPRDTGFVKVR